MTDRERFVAVVRNQPVDYVPIFGFTGGPGVSCGCMRTTYNRLRATGMPDMGGCWELDGEPFNLDGMPVLREMEYGYTATDNPALVTGRFKPGSVVLVNLAPVGIDGAAAGQARYRLIVAPAEMLPVLGPDRMEEYIRGWFRPKVPVADFLAGYSRLGGTHHLAVAYAADMASLTRFGEMMGWEVSVVE